MRAIRTLTLAVSALLYATAPAHADINALINFDDLLPGASHLAIGDASGVYQGLAWNNFYAFSEVGNPLYRNGVVSEPNAAFVDSNISLLGNFFTVDGSAVQFTSAYFTATNTNGNVVTRPGTVSYVDVFGIDPNLNADCGGLGQSSCLFRRVAINGKEPTLATFDWTVSGVSFGAVATTSNPVPFNVVIDNLQISPVPASSPVPEPGAVFLFGVVGAAVLPLIRRRFRQV